jgi:hypothetical protein
LENGINKILNNLVIAQKETINIEILSLLDNYLRTYHGRNFFKLYDWKVNSKYPKVEIYIMYMKGGEIYEIIPLRFERLQKLLKLKNL